MGPLEEHPLLSTAELFLEPYVSSAILYSQPPCRMGSFIFLTLGRQNYGSRRTGDLTTGKRMNQGGFKPHLHDCDFLLAFECHTTQQS